MLFFLFWTISPGVVTTTLFSLWRHIFVPNLRGTSRDVDLQPFFWLFFLFLSFFFLLPFRVQFHLKREEESHVTNLNSGGNYVINWVILAAASVCVCVLSEDNLEYFDPKGISHHHRIAMAPNSTLNGTAESIDNGTSSSDDMVSTPTLSPLLSLPSSLWLEHLDVTHDIANTS